MSSASSRPYEPHLCVVGTVSCTELLGHSGLFGYRHVPGITELSTAGRARSNSVVHVSDLGELFYLRMQHSTFTTEVARGMDRQVTKTQADPSQERPGVCPHGRAPHSGERAGGRVLRLA